jgi:phospholipid/cholesterol/gamma-HCH transport system permease protein
VETSPTAFVKPQEGRLGTRLTRSYLNFIGRGILHLIRTIHGLGAFALITLGVTVTKFGESSKVIHPLVLSQIHRAGLRLLPMISFLGVALGLVIIGQAVALLNKYGAGAQNYAGVVMVAVVVRELGPLVTALLVLARVGTAIVIDLSTQRAMGEVEALEALGIDPIHYLVAPRVWGLAISIFALTIYLIIVALISGYVFAFIQDVPLKPGEYFEQMASSLVWEDFLLLALKTLTFGGIIAVITCYQGLAHPVRIEDISNVTTNAVVESVVACLLIDALFIVIYMVLI